MQDLLITSTGASNWTMLICHRRSVRCLRLSPTKTVEYQRTEHACDLLRRHPSSRQVPFVHPVIVSAKGRNVRFSVNPPSGPGNCNVVARPNSELSGMSQPVLNREIESLPIDQASWAEYVGLPPSQVRVIETRRARIHEVPAVLGVLETTLENLEGKFTRKQIMALTFTPGLIWSLNCGASTFKADDARSRFVELQPTFNKVFGSFAFLK